MLLWDVDTQVDFLAPDGHLYVPGSEKIIPNLRRLTAWADQHHVPIVSSACAHRPGDSELRQYGQHCMIGTPGQQKVPGTLLQSRFVVPNQPVELPNLREFEQVIIEKQEFDFATNPNAGAILRQFAQISEVVLYGVVTEICVAAAARSLLAYGRKVSLVGDAVAELDRTKAEAFVAEFTSRGGTLITTSQVTCSSEEVRLEAREKHAQ
jgi:nicotinamidase/pyrazinamidase